MPPPPPQNNPNVESESNHNSISVDVETLISWENSINGIESNNEKSEEALLLLPTVVGAAECVEESAMRSTHRAVEGTTSSEKDLDGRQRLKRHRVEVAGRVWVPNMWGQEDLLKDWIDCAAFDLGLANRSIVSARAALVEEGRRRRRRNSTRLRVKSSC